MSVITIPLKTHSRIEVNNGDGLNECVTHHCKPKIYKMIVGRKKEVWFVANCLHDDCGKIGYTENDVIAAWNKLNPLLNKEQSPEECDATKAT